MNKKIIFFLVFYLLLIGALIFSALIIFEEKSNKEIFPEVEKEATEKTGVSEEVKNNLDKKTEKNSKEETIMGIYEICSDLGECDVEEGIKKIKKAGFKAIILTVIDEDREESLAYYPSSYLKMADYVDENYVEEAIELAHKNGIKIYASINLPHNYWLKKHPDWITVWSDGKSGDFYNQDYFHRTVPPSRILSETECLEFLSKLFKEVQSYGFDGIDINDNFQFSDEYIEEKDEILFSSYDEFTVNKFNSQDKLNWFEWRALEVGELIKFFKENIEIIFRPHLLTHGNPYEYYGLDYRQIENYVDVMYLMIMPDQPKNKYNLIDDIKNKKIAVSTYFFNDLASFEEILEIINLLKTKKVQEIYLYNFKIIEEDNLWDRL